ncbi:MAG: sugar phosphate isomerase/epimerase family protein, partial [Planctomycetota bacterium]
AKVVVVHTGDLTSKGTSKLNLQLASQVAEYAGRCGVKLALENGTLSFLADAVEKIKDLGICLDVGHVYFTPSSMEEFLTKLKKRIIHLHLQDILIDKQPALGIDFPEHYIPGTEKIPKADWFLLVETLREINFDGMAVFEIAPHNPLQTAFLGKTFIQKIINS